MAGPGGELDQISARTAVEKARQTALQVAGRDEGGRTGQIFRDARTQSTGSHTGSILVTNLKTGGAYDKYWGLKRFDSIVQIGPLPVNDISSPGDADHHGDGRVSAQRADRRDPRQSEDHARRRLGRPATTAPAIAGAPGTPAPQQTSDPLQKQLDIIQKITDALNENSDLITERSDRRPRLLVFEIQRRQSGVLRNLEDEPNIGGPAVALSSDLTGVAALYSATKIILLVQLELRPRAVRLVLLSIRVDQRE